MGRGAGATEPNALHFSHPKTFPVRFARKFGKLPAGAKARDCTYTHRCFAAASQAISARAWANCFVPGRALVFTL